jgi:hypothetical protein
MSFDFDPLDKLYYFKGCRINQSTEFSAVSPSKTMDTNVFHGILAHADFFKCKLMAKSIEINLSGSKLYCGAFVLAKAVPKTTANKSNRPGGRLFLDVSGPYLESIGGSKYWLRVVDDYNCYAWDCFLTKKNDLREPFETLLTKLRGLVVVSHISSM